MKIEEDERIFIRCTCRLEKSIF